MSETRRRRGGTRGTRHICAPQRRKKKDRLYREQDGKCAGCGTAAEQADLILKHKIHRKDGGTGELTNLHLICHDCNHNGPREQGPGAVN